MIGIAFKSMVQYLTKLEGSPEDWHLALSGEHTHIHKLQYPPLKMPQSIKTPHFSVAFTDMFQKV
jgi:hypothetical protein